MLRVQGATGQRVVVSFQPKLTSKALACVGTAGEPLATAACRPGCRCCDTACRGGGPLTQGPTRSPVPPSAPAAGPAAAGIKPSQGPPRGRQLQGRGGGPPVKALPSSEYIATPWVDHHCYCRWCGATCQVVCKGAGLGSHGLHQPLNGCRRLQVSLVWGRPQAPLPPPWDERARWVRDSPMGWPTGTMVLLLAMAGTPTAEICKGSQ